MTVPVHKALLDKIHHSLPGLRRLVRVLGNARCKIRSCQRTAPEHQRPTATLGERCARIGYAPDFTVDARTRVSDGSDSWPVGRRAIAIELGTRMDRKLVRSGEPYRARNVSQLFSRVISKPYLDGYRDRCRRGITHRRDDRCQALWITQQH